jgi:hypothetical protein
MALDIVTLAIAVSALLLSVVALTWQVVQHYLVGDRVSVELMWGGFGQDGVVVGPISEGSLESIHWQGFSDLLFAVRGRNWGRQAVDITGYSVSIDSGLSVSAAGSPMNPSLPHRLEAGSRVDFYVPINQVLAAVDASSEVVQQSHGKLRGTLDLGSGKTVLGGWQTLPSPTAPPQ